MMREAWVREFATWFPGMPVTAIRNPADKVADFGVTIVSHIGAQDRANVLHRDTDIFINDESQFLCNPDSKRTQSIYGPKCDGVDGLISHAGRAWSLSGTPVLNHPGELWSLLRSHGIASKSHDYFLRKFTHSRQTQYGRSVFGAKNLDALRASLNGFMLRRQLTNEIPPVTHQDVTCEWTNADLDKLRAFDLDPEIIDEAAESDPEDGPHMATARRALGLLKIPALITHISSALVFDTDSIVVFCQHKQVMDALKEALNPFGVVEARGGMADRPRQRSVDAFQRPGGPRVIICQKQAAATGITLTRSARILNAEPDWSPAADDQAFARVARLGQTREVLAENFLIDHPLEHATMRVQRRKRAMIDSLFG